MCLTTTNSNKSVHTFLLIFFISNYINLTMNRKCFGFFVFSVISMDSQYNSTGFGNEYNECNAYKCDNDGIKYQSKFYSKDEHVMEIYHI